MYLALIEEREDQEFFIGLYEEYHEGMLRYARSRLNGRCVDQAEDIVQEAFTSAAKSIQLLKRLDPMQRQKYLVTIIRRQAWNIRRKEEQTDHSSLDELDYRVPDTIPLPLELIMTREGYEQVIECIASLGDTYRNVMEMRLLFGMTETEIAEELNVTIKTANVRIYRGRQKLQELLEQAAEPKPVGKKVEQRR